MGHPMVLGIIPLTIWDFITIRGIPLIITGHLFILDLAGAGAVMAVDTHTIHLIIIRIIIIGMVTIKVTGMAIMLLVAIMAMDTIHITGQDLRVEDLTALQLPQARILLEYQTGQVHLRHPVQI